MYFIPVSEMWKNREQTQKRAPFQSRKHIEKWHERVIFLGSWNYFAGECDYIEEK